MLKALWRAVIGGFISDDQKMASKNDTQTVQDWSAKTIPYLKTKINTTQFMTKKGKKSHTLGPHSI